MTSCFIDHLEVSPNCLGAFQKYKLIGEIAVGVGSFGVIYNVINLETSEESALKATAVIEDYTENEVSIHCQVSSIPGFIKFKNYFTCNEQPSDWLTATQSEVSLVGEVVYIEMEKARGSMYDLLEDIQPRMEIQDAKSILFEIISSLFHAHRTLKFCHRDLKIDNILYNIETNPRTYELPFNDGQTLKFQASSIYRPLIADFGNSSVNEEDCWIDKVALAGIVSRHFTIFQNTNYMFQLNALMEQIQETSDYADVLQSNFFADLYV